MSDLLDSTGTNWEEGGKTPFYGLWTSEAAKEEAEPQHYLRQHNSISFYLILFLSQENLQKDDNKPKTLRIHI